MSNGLVISTVCGVTVVSFRDRSILDGVSVDRLADQLYELVDGQAKRMILLDFRNVRFLSSTMMGVLLALQAKAEKIDGQIVISGLKPSLRQAVRLMRLDDVLTLAETEQEALGKFKLTGAAG